MESMAEAGANVVSSAINGVARIEIAESLQDHFEREYFAASGRLRREGGVARVTIPALHHGMCVDTLSCPGNTGAIANNAPLDVSADERSLFGSVAVF